MTTIRPIEDADVDEVLDYIASHVARTAYHRVMPDPLQNAPALMAAARARGVALAAFDAGVVVGCLIMPLYEYMGSQLTEEVAWFAETHRDLLRLFDQGEAEAVQKGATVVKLSAPAWTRLGAFYKRRGYQEIETVFVKVIDHGVGSSRDNRDRPPRGLSREGREEEERG